MQGWREVLAPCSHGHEWSTTGSMQHCLLAKPPSLPLQSSLLLVAINSEDLSCNITQRPRVLLHFKPYLLPDVLD